MRLSSSENLLIVYWGFPAVGFVECCWSIDINSCHKTCSSLNCPRLPSGCGSWELYHLFIFISPLLLLILFQTKLLLLLATYSSNTRSPFGFPLSKGVSWRCPKKGCQAPSAYRPGLESRSKQKHSWHPVRDGLALSNYLASLVRYYNLDMRSLASLSCTDSQVELSDISSTHPHPPRSCLV